VGHSGTAYSRWLYEYHQWHCCQKSHSPTTVGSGVPALDIPVTVECPFWPCLFLYITVLYLFEVLSSTEVIGTHTYSSIPYHSGVLRSD
jgi:hypothetical protein